jgi:uncharacterized membrane protein
MMGWYGGWGGGPVWAMGLMTVFWVALTIGVAWAAVRLLGGGRPPEGPAATPTPRATLDHRLATGEIDVEEYARLRRLLEGQSVDTGPTDPDGRR